MTKDEDIKDAIKLYKEQVIWKNKSDKDLAMHIIPSVALNQYHIFRYENTGVAYAFTNWAFLSDEVQESFKLTGELGKFDWDSGKTCWHIDTINNHWGKIREIYQWTAKHLSTLVSDDEYVHWLRLDKSGKKVKRINKIKGSEGKRKFLND